MSLVFKRLFPGIVLIVLTSGALLISDRQHRKSGVKRAPRVAIAQYSSQPVLIEGVQGALAGLQDSGFRAGDSMVLKQYNAEGDLATADAIAREVTGGDFEIVLTVSTPMMQTVANANKAGRVIHIFGLVADPFGAGVGIRRDNPLDHPKHMVGLGTFLPAGESFSLARKFFPDLKSVGVVWNPGESNSEAFTLRAREASQKLGIRLVEANVDNSSGVLEAIHSVISRGAEAIWIGGDNTVLLTLDSVVAAARKARIPVFTITPGDPKRGTLFDLGADFYEAGHLTGKLAGEVLLGADAATIPVRDFVPRRLVVNKLALRGLKEPWRAPEDILAGANVVVDEGGIHERDRRASGPGPGAALGKR
jgi:putative ABC transport system substrate-binding protein